MFSAFCWRDTVEGGTVNGILLSWEQEHNAIQRTIQSFWGAFRSWRNENKDRYQDLFLGKLNEDFINIDVVSISLKQCYDRDGAAIFCSLRIHYLNTRMGPMIWSSYWMAR